jgi:hypothetical protein
MLYDFEIILKMEENKAFKTLFSKIFEIESWFQRQSRRS